jgi:hypothetical protein
MQRVPGTGIRTAFAIAAIATSIMFAGNAKADIFYDTTLASPDTNPATNAVNSATNNASWYDGTGNPQGGWTVDSSNGIEIGLRAKYRGVNAVIDTPNNVYQVAAGVQSGTSNALWNYEFSIDLQPNGVGSLTIADIENFSTLTVDDLTTGVSHTILLANLAGDDSGFGTTNGNTGPDRISESSDPAAFAAGWGAQNSENPAFGNWPLAGLQAFDPNANDTYLIELNVKTNADHVVASDSIEVQVTPEPSAIILLATMVLGTFILVRRRKATQS